MEVSQYKLRTIQWKFMDARKEFPEVKIDQRVKITSPDKIASVFKPLLKDEARENFVVVWLNTSNKIMGFEVVSIGNLNSSIVHPREVFRGAIVNGAASIILIHNHPSGDPEPSNEDISITQKVVQAGKIINIPVFDHIIIANEQYTSFAERRLI